MQNDLENQRHRCAASAFRTRRIFKKTFFVAVALMVVPLVIAARCIVLGACVWVQCILIAATSGRLEVGK